MTRTNHGQNKSVQMPDYSRFALCLIGDESEGLTKVQTKPITGDRATP
jgi:hypothetical protein